MRHSQRERVVSQVRPFVFTKCRYALNEHLFAKFLNDEDVVRQLLEIFQQTKTELVLNVVGFCEFSRWGQHFIRKFIDCVAEIVNAGYEKNRILLTCNPALAIALASEYLQDIGRYMRVFRRECDDLVKNMLDLGNKIVENFEVNLRVLYCRMRLSRACFWTRTTRSGR